MFLCCSKCFTSEMEDDAPIQEIGDTATVQILNNANKQIKWIASDAKPDAPISVHFSNDDQSWQLQRKKDIGLWTVHTMHENQELFITYEISSGDVRLGLDEENTSRYFKALVAPGGGLYLIPQNTDENEEDHFLCIMGGKLALSPKPSIEWEIKINGAGESDSTVKNYRVLVTDVTGVKGWTCGDNEVKIGEITNRETWVTSIRTKRSKGRAPRIDYIWEVAFGPTACRGEEQRYLTWTDGDKSVKLRADLPPEEIKKFKVLKKTGTGAVHFMPLSNLTRFVQMKQKEDASGEVLGIAEGDMKQAAQFATDWFVKVVGLPIDKGSRFFPC